MLAGPGADRYEIRRKLGAGGMGVVYEALDRERNTHVALKTLRQMDAGAMQRFKHEFRALSDVSHPNLVSLYELVVERDRAFFTMELVDGVDFVKWVRRDPEVDDTIQEEETGSTESLMKLTPTGPFPTGVRRRMPTSPADNATLDLRRLRSSLADLCEAVAAIHGAGMLHRDIKPSNVLVDERGRVVVLDFGLIVDLEREAAGSSEDRPRVGTPAYMSPEQGARLPLTPASDWYSVGVILYKSLTGRLPFAGGQADVLMDKQQFEPPPPIQIAADVPEDLNALCVELLRRNPERRPPGKEVLRRVGVQIHETSPATTRSSLAVDSILVGREAHMQKLHGAFADVREGEASLVYVHGPSGMGKSALLSKFLSELRDEGVVLLRGRCYERESVPYKALDSLVDALSDYLGRLDSFELEGLMPRDALSLSRVFPVLRQIEALTAGRRRQRRAADDHELRRRAFAALRELLARLADRRPLVLAIDDLQWGDADSAALLAELLRPPDPPPLLLLACYRSEDRGTSRFLDAFRDLVDEDETAVTDVAVGPLNNSEARDLAIIHLGDGARAREHADRIAEESGGSPFFVEELARHVLDQIDSAAPEQVSLDDAVRARLRRLPEPAAQLLAAIAVEARPMPQALAFRAARVKDPGALALLKAGNFVRTRSVHGERFVECYHDRVRETVVAELSPDELRQCHQRLANALAATPNPDPETLATHYHGAGDAPRAAEFAAAAAARAADTLAFDRAARLYALAIELDPTERAELREMRVALADALANAGRGPDAAEAYLRACDGAAPTTQLELRRRAAMQLLQSGYFPRGLEVLREVLGAVGMRLAASPKRALALLLWRRLRLSLRGLRFKQRDPGSIPANELTRVDIARAASEGLAMIDGIRGSDYQVRYLLLALDAGDPVRVARAMGGEAAFVSLAGSAATARTAKIVARMQTVAQDLDRAEIQAAATDLIPGVVAFHEGRWREAYDHTRRAEEVLREQPGMRWELSTTQLFKAYSQSTLGQIRELCAELPIVLKEAHERSDRYAATTLRTSIGFYRFITADDPAAAEADLDDAIAHWPTSGFFVQNMAALISKLAVICYAGDGKRALDLSDELHTTVKRSMMLRPQVLRVFYTSFRGRAAVAAAAVDGNKDLLRRAEADAARLAKEGPVFATAFAHMLHAGIANVRGDRERAADQLRAAKQLLESTEMQLFLAAVDERLGHLIKGDEGAELVEASAEYYRREGWRDPKRTTACMLPGF